MNRAAEVVEIPLSWPQIAGQAHQLFFDFIPLDGNGGTVERNHCAVSDHCGAGCAGRDELNVTRGDQIRCDDDCVGVIGNGHIAVDVHAHLGLGALGIDRIDAADFDPRDRTSSPG